MALPALGVIISTFQLFSPRSQILGFRSKYSRLLFFFLRVTEIPVSCFNLGSALLSEKTKIIREAKRLAESTHRLRWETKLEQNEDLKLIRVSPRMPNCINPT